MGDLISDTILVLDFKQSDAKNMLGLLIVIHHRERRSLIEDFGRAEVYK